MLHLWDYAASSTRSNVPLTFDLDLIHSVQSSQPDPIRAVIIAALTECEIVGQLAQWSASTLPPGLLSSIAVWTDRFVTGALIDESRRLIAAAVDERLHSGENTLARYMTARRHGQGAAAPAPAAADVDESACEGLTFRHEGLLCSRDQLASTLARARVCSVIERLAGAMTPGYQATLRAEWEMSTHWWGAPEPIPAPDVPVTTDPVLQRCRLMLLRFAQQHLLHVIFPDDRNDGPLPRPTLHDSESDPALVAQSGASAASDRAPVVVVILFRPGLSLRSLQAHDIVRIAVLRKLRPPSTLGADSADASISSSSAAAPSTSMDMAGKVQSTDPPDNSMFTFAEATALRRCLHDDHQALRAGTTYTPAHHRNLRSESPLFHALLSLLEESTSDLLDPLADLCSMLWIQREDGLVQPDHELRPLLNACAERFRQLLCNQPHVIPARAPRQQTSSAAACWPSLPKRSGDDPVPAVRHCACQLSTQVWLSHEFHLLGPLGITDSAKAGLLSIDRCEMYLDFSHGGGISIEMPALLVWPLDQDARSSSASAVSAPCAFSYYETLIATDNFVSDNTILVGFTCSVPSEGRDVAADFTIALDMTGELRVSDGLLRAHPDLSMQLQQWSAWKDPLSERLSRYRRYRNIDGHRDNFIVGAAVDHDASCVYFIVENLRTSDIPLPSALCASLKFGYVAFERCGYHASNALAQLNLGHAPFQHRPRARCASMMPTLYPSVLRHCALFLPLDGLCSLVRTCKEWRPILDAAAPILHVYRPRPSGRSTFPSLSEWSARSCLVRHVCSVQSPQNEWQMSRNFGSCAKTQGAMIPFTELQVMAAVFSRVTRFSGLVCTSIACRRSKATRDQPAEGEVARSADGLCGREVAMQADMEHRCVDTVVLPFPPALQSLNLQIEDESEELSYDAYNSRRRRLFVTCSHVGQMALCLYRSISTLRQLRTLCLDHFSERWEDPWAQGHAYPSQSWSRCAHIRR